MANKENQTSGNCFCPTNNILKLWFTNAVALGELTASWRGHEDQDLALAVEARRREQQDVADEEFAVYRETVEERVRHREEDVKDDIADHLRWYIEHWFRVVGELPTFPEPTKILPHELLGFPKGRIVDKRLRLRSMTKIYYGVFF